MFTCYDFRYSSLLACFPLRKIPPVFKFNFKLSRENTPLPVFSFAAVCYDNARCHSATYWTGVFKNKSNAIHLKPLIKDYFKKYLEYNTAYLQQNTAWHAIFACFTRETCSCHRKPLIKINNCCFCLTRGLICRNGVLPTTSRRRWRMRKRV